eukprot:768689-Hanusia_phi.AAC.8
MIPLLHSSNSHTIQHQKPPEALDFLESLDPSIKWKCFLGVPPSQRAVFQSHSIVVHFCDVRYQAIMLEMDESDRQMALDMLRPEERTVIEKFLEMKKGTAKSNQNSRPKRAASSKSSVRIQKTMEITSSTPVEQLQVQADVINDMKVVRGQQDSSALEKRLFENAKTSDAPSHVQHAQSEGAQRSGYESGDGGNEDKQDGVMISSSPLQRLGNEPITSNVLTTFSMSKPPLPKRNLSSSNVQDERTRQHSVSVFEPYNGIDPQEMETISQKLSDMQQQITEIEKLGEEKYGRRSPFGTPPQLLCVSSHAWLTV